MRIIEHDLTEMHAARRAIQGVEIGLVPTMGFLHEGHLELVRSAKRQSQFVIVSIFVNPTQFGEGEDLDSYPSNIPNDLAMLKAEGVDLVWLPGREMMYPEGFQTWVDVTDLSLPLEGDMRPGHFKGVSTIVSKLFNATQPDKAFFGQKDAQQVAVIKQMTHDLSYPIEIVVVPTAREEDGLARSSRNVYLNEEERIQASTLHKALKAAESAYQNGEHDAEVIRKMMLDIFDAAPLAIPQYVSCAHPRTLQELETVGENGALLSMAVYFGKTRLIDNLILQ